MPSAGEGTDCRRTALRRSRRSQSGPDGTLYGTTHDGGSADDGTVYKISPNGAETVLHSFTGGSDGLYPIAAVMIGKDGKLYGTTGGVPEQQLRHDFQPEHRWLRVSRAVPI